MESEPVLMYLSKSRYCSAVQCPKILWMAKNMPEEFDDSVMDAYAALHEQPPEEIEKIREALLAYCKLDTLGMVRILGKLRELK